MVPTVFRPAEGGPRCVGRRPLRQCAMPSLTSLDMYSALCSMVSPSQFWYRFERGQPGATGTVPRAQAASLRRAIFFMTGNGVVMDDWRPPSPDKPTGNAILKPLEFVKDKVMTIEGVPMTSTFDKENTAQGHPGGSAGVLTGAHAGCGKMYGGCGGCFGAGFAMMPSIDAGIAEYLGRATRFPSYHVGAKVMDNTVARRFFYSAPGQSISPTPDPYKAGP